MKNISQNIKPINHKMNWFQQFLIICSGGNLHILRKTPSEWNKFAGIGGIVLFTAVFATLSAGYAMFTVFDDLWVSAGFGLLWGLMIFNLDRYIVSSIKKTGNLVEPDFNGNSKVDLSDIFRNYYFQTFRTENI